MDRNVYKFSLFWDVTQHRLLVCYRRFGTTCRPNFQGSSSGMLDLLRWNRLSRNVCCSLPICTAQHPRRDLSL